MKIVKHVDIEYYAGISDVAGETCQGLLTGLISIDDKRLEITNCFPTPRAELLLEGDEAATTTITNEEKQNEILDTLKRFRFHLPKSYFPTVNIILTQKYEH
jgi:hypothetical protein